MSSGIPKDYRRYERALLWRGYEAAGTDSKSHYRYVHPDLPTLTIPCSPSDSRTVENDWAKLLRIAPEVRTFKDTGRAPRRKRQRRALADQAHVSILREIRGRFASPSPPRNESEESAPLRHRRHLCGGCGFTFTVRCRELKPCPKCKSQSMRELEAA